MEEHPLQDARGMPAEARLNTTARLTERLELIYRWYAGMVNPETGMLEYLYLPQSDTFVRERSAIRDIASVWIVAVLSEFLHRRDLDPLIETSLQHYGRFLVERDGYRFLDLQATPRHRPGARTRLDEPPSIAHSAFMLLALLHAPPPRNDRRLAWITGLAQGILRQQRPDGSYRVYFVDLPDAGEELYAGEAMLALMETFRQFPDPRYRQSVERAFSYYDAQYFRRGRVEDDLLVFFANWQSQAGRLLFEATPSPALRQEVAAFLFGLHDRIIARGFYDAVARFPARQVSVEVACALEGLNDAYALARATSDRRATTYHQCVCTGLDYLLRAQRLDRCTDRERGGFGMSLDERAQRIDVTGHAASAFLKSVANGIECPPNTGAA
jgi:hypothetical protein